MPIYEYECGKCGHTLEAIQKISDSPLSDCPECGAAALKKLVSAAGFRLKGTGWYETDFKNRGKPAARTEDKKAGGDKDKVESKGASDSKPAATAPKESPKSTASGGD